MMRVLLLLILVASVVVADEIDILVPKEVTVDAAFRFGPDLFLISGQEYMAITPNGIERYLKVRHGDTHVPVTWHIQAAVNWPRKATVYYYGNETSIRTNQTSMVAKVRAYGRHRTFLQNGGPDAASFKAGWFYIFRGCEFVKQAGTLWYLGEPQSIASIDPNLPCDIDAAWSSVDRNSMTILKGDQIWTWTGEEVSGPVPFESQYTIWSWQLKPSPDNRFAL